MTLNEADQILMAADRARHLSIKSVAARLDCHPDTVQRMIKAGELPGAWRLRGEWRVPARDLEKLAERGRIAA